MLLGACGETATSSVSLREAGVGDATLAQGAWGRTECGTCALEACSAERATCGADPLCARNLECLEACDVDSDQEPAAACASRCPDTRASTESEAARAALDLCRTRGAGAGCTPCYGGARTHYEPALTNVCPSPHWDAGPDATPEDELFSKCTGERCCAVRDACNNDPDCSALRACVAATTDRPMKAACYAQYDSALALLGQRYACFDVLCASILAPDDDCLRCVNDSCGDLEAACLNTHDCILLYFCTAACTTADSQCMPNCLAQYPAAVDAYGGYAQCVGTSCRVCGAGTAGGK